MGIQSSQPEMMPAQSLPPSRHSLVGPVALITLGVLFLTGQFVPGWGIAKTWPLLLVVIGVTKLFDSILAGRRGPSGRPAGPSEPGGSKL